MHSPNKHWRPPVGGLLCHFANWMPEAANQPSIPSGSTLSACMDRRLGTHHRYLCLVYDGDDNPVFCFGSQAIRFENWRGAGAPPPRHQSLAKSPGTSGSSGSSGAHFPLLGVTRPATSSEEVTFSLSPSLWILFQCSRPLPTFPSSYQPITKPFYLI